jgi:hypothetical protein
MEILQLLIENGDSIMASIGAILTAIVWLLTVIQKFMPDKIENKWLVMLEAITSKFSLGTKKSTVVKK